MHDESNAAEGGDQLRLVPSRAEDIAWAAGLFEGEGCWNAYRFKDDRRKTGKNVNVQARLAMTDEDVVERFAAIVGFGTIRRNIVRRANEKPVTEWYTQRRANVRMMIEMFKPYLGARRFARAMELLDLGEAKPMNERTHCPKGHPLSGDNLVLEPITRDGRRYFARRCKICRTEQSRERARKKRGIKPENYRI